jgi:hypothetical protein
MGKMRNTYKIWVGMLECKRPLERPRHRWEDKINMDHGEKVWEGVEWIHLAPEGPVMSL